MFLGSIPFTENLREGEGREGGREEGEGRRDREGKGRGLNEEDLEDRKKKVHEKDPTILFYHPSSSSLILTFSPSASSKGYVLLMLQSSW